VTQVLAQEVVAAGVPPTRVEVIANGVDPCRFTPLERDEAKRKLKLEGRLVLGFTGFVREWHRAEQLLDLLSGPTVPSNAHFLLVGDGPVRAALEEKATQLGVRDRLSITGVVSRERVPEYIAAFDVALQPHVVSYASPLKLFEYMASGRAIVAPDTPNIREILTHEFDGLLFDQAMQGAFAAAVLRLACDADLRARLETNARRTIRDRRLTWRDNALRVAGLAEALRANSSTQSDSIDSARN
jgi:glycosyltransferase involved in cell wall biosynthesis